MSATPQHAAEATPDTTLERSLGPWMLWALGVGYVISGMYFGWNLGLPVGGPYGMLAALALVTVMYVTFVLSYTELACAMPRAGGAFVYASVALGPRWGFLAGMGQSIEFVFAPPAIAAAIGAYFSIFFPALDATVIATAFYLIFTLVNIWGVKLSAVFELVITVLAVLELLLFAGLTLPHFSPAAFATDPLPAGWAYGTFAAIPYAIWFYLAIEGIANVAEEAKNPQRDMVRGFGSAMATLVVLAIITFFGAVGVAGWRAVVFKDGSTATSDSPLPLALAKIVGEHHTLYHLLIGIGVCGLLASFHGILLIAGRSTMEFGRAGYAPAFLGRTLPTRKTPAAALVANMAIGLVALWSGKTGEIITMSVLGAVTMYALSSLSLLVLRRKRPDLARPYKTPGFPVVPAIALVLSVVSLVSLCAVTPIIALVFAALLVGGFAWYGFALPAHVKERASQWP